MIWRLAQDLDLPEFWPYGHLKGPETENEALKKERTFVISPMDENSRRHEKVYYGGLLICQSYLNYKLQPLQLDHNFRIKFCRHVFSHIQSGIIYATDYGLPERK